LKIVQTVLLFCFLLLFGSQITAQVKTALKVPFADTIINKGKDTIKIKFGKDTVHFPIADKRGDFLSDPSKNPFEFHDTSVLKRRVEYDPKNKSYSITEMVAGKPQRIPATLSFDEFWQLKTNKDEQAYFMQRANSLGTLNRKISRPKAKVYDSYFDRLFGKTGSDLKVDIKPVGEINIKAGYQGQTVDNPTLPEAARKNGGFDFDANTNFSMNASIGDKLKIPINLNSLSNLGFDNQIKLSYKGKKDEIVKAIDAGNINYISRSTLIPSTQNLFGVKTQLQFGRLFVTAALANQKSQRQSMNLQGGATTQHFQKRLDDYEENRHFLLAQYFRNNYNKAMSNLPVVNSQAQIKKIEVWVTNRNGQTTNARDIVGLADLGESRPSKKSLETNPGNVYPDNSSNSLYPSIINDPKSRNPSDVSTILAMRGLRSSEDYERTFARKLTENEYFFNPQIGFLSLNIPLQPDEVLAVAFQYTYNGRVYQVGEFSDNIALNPNNGVQQIMFLKLIKATTQRTDLPIWDLMMKNVYSLDLFGTIQPTDFQLNVLYEDPSLGQKRYLPVTDAAVNGQALIKILQLDRLNSRNDPQPDGVFDYVEGFTVLSKMGRIVFPLLEPFGDDLKNIAFKKLFQTDSVKANKYLFPQLYRNIKSEAQTYTNLNRYVMEGQVKGAGGGSEISLNAFNVPQGSVTVRAGGQILKEGTDYIVDYGSGTVRIINPGILSSNIPVNVSFENNLGFGFQERGFRALRLDYMATKNFNLGFSTQRLSERPFFTKTNFGSDPIKNAMYGVDFNYKGELPSITKALNKLPFYKTKAKSYITTYGEAAYLQPGHAQQIGTGGSGLVYLDDFESTRTNIDLRFPFTSWALSSTPMDRFKEGALSDSIDYNKNRARIAWYTIEPVLQDRNSSNNPMSSNLPALSDPRVRQVFTNELFPNKTTNITDVQLPTFDLTYYPKDRGPYNYNFKDLNTKGQFVNPTEKWGGIMRALDQTDFETNVIEYVEFWVQNPFLKSPATSGKLVLNLGNVSEDILKDGRRFYENGLPTPTLPASIDSSNWGKVPTNPIQVTNAFSNNPDDRKYQDVGLDGLNDEEERLKRKNVIDQITNTTVKQQFLNDPSADNYKWYRDDSYTASNAGILDRYKYFNNTQGNSPLAGTSVYSSAATMLPDNEDLNRDNTLNESESYWEYVIDLKKGNLGVGKTAYITDSKQVTATLADGSQSVEDWYLFRVPIRDPQKNAIGGITDFRSIRFMRMYMTGFEDSITLRFAKLDLVRNQWRQYANEIDSSGNYKTIGADNTSSINTLAVSIEQNGSRQPVNYVIPPGIERVQLLSNNGVNLLQNEQALSVQINHLQKGKTPRGIFKTMNIDIRKYGNLSMFLHAESQMNTASPIKDKELTAIIRMGQDFQNNFYEIRIPLKVTPKGTYTSVTADAVWPESNSMNLNLNDLVNLKLQRDKQHFSYTAKFPMTVTSGTNAGQRYSVMGNPNLGEIRGIMIAFENSSTNEYVDAEVWMNELRLSQMDESGSYAALGKMDLILADLGNLSISMNKRTAGFGTIEQSMNQRAKTGVTQFDIATNIDAGKLLPKQIKISIPVFAGLNKSIENPEYDPFNKDIKYDQEINTLQGRQRDSVINLSTNQSTIKTLNFTNVRVLPKGKPTLLSISNFDVSYSYSQLLQTSPVIEQNKMTKQRGAVGYTFNNQVKSIEPFKKLIKTNWPWLTWMKDFNFSPAPSLISYRTVLDRQYGEYTPRIINSSDRSIDKVETTYDKYFTKSQLFNMRWPFTRSLNMDFSANMNSIIDEPDGPNGTLTSKDLLTRIVPVINSGRNTLYSQKASMRYDLPTTKLPLTNWILANVNAATSYNWVGASRLAVELGNTIENTLAYQGSVQLNFNTLYKKSKFLNAAISDEKVAVKQAIINPLATKILMTKSEALAGKIGKARDSTLKKWREARRQERIAQRVLKANEQINVPGSIKTIARFLTMLKTASGDYTESFNSRLPGYDGNVEFLNKTGTGFSPTIDYMFLGKQPDSNWLNDQYTNHQIKRDPNFNMIFRQTFDQKFSFRMMVEPIKTLIIDVMVNKSYIKEYTELFKDTNYNAAATNYNNPTHANPLSAGGFNISYMALNTFFSTHNPNVISTQFKAFEDYRQQISLRVAANNEYWNTIANKAKTPEGYAVGYSKYAQDVLIPAFIAAYTGQDPQKVSLLNQTNSSIRSNPFSGMLPKPNWNILYNGLAKTPLLSTIFSNITLTHGYNSNLSMNGFTSSLMYADTGRRNAPSFIDTVSKNYIPYFLVPNITISERMEPLIGINLTTISQWSLRFEYKKSRILSLSLIDYQLSENNSTEYVFGTAYRKKGLKLPFTIPGLNNNKLNNDLTLRFDMAIRDVYNSNSRLDQKEAYGTGGQKEITIQPSIDYVLNSKINLKFFFDQRRTTPYISSSPPITNTRAGVNIRIAL
jgi:hypothetical protein